MCFGLKSRNEAAEGLLKGGVPKVVMAGPAACHLDEFRFLKACQCCLIDYAAKPVDCVDEDGAFHHPALSAWCWSTNACIGEDGRIQRMNSDFFFIHKIH